MAFSTLYLPRTQAHLSAIRPAFRSLPHHSNTSPLSNSSLHSEFFTHYHYIPSLCISPFIVPLHSTNHSLLSPFSSSLLHQFNIPSLSDINVSIFRVTLNTTSAEFYLLCVSHFHCFSFQHSFHTSLSSYTPASLSIIILHISLLHPSSNQFSSTSLQHVSEQPFPKSPFSSTSLQHPSEQPLHSSPFSFYIIPASV